MTNITANIVHSVISMTPYELLLGGRGSRNEWRCTYEDDRVSPKGCHSSSSNLILDAHSANISINREKVHKKWISQHLQLLQLHLGGGRGTGFIRDWHSSLDDEERRRRDRPIPRDALMGPTKRRGGGLLLQEFI